MNNLSSYCGLTDSRMRASEKGLPVTHQICKIEDTLEKAKWLPLTLTEDSRYQKKGPAVYHATWAIAAIYGTTWWEWSARILYNKDHGLKVVNYRNHFLLGLGQNRNAKFFRADTETTQNQQIQVFLSRYNTWPRILYNKAVL